MAFKKTIIKNLSSIQNFGAMNILCTDKTGTLTEDRIVLELYINPNGENDDKKAKMTCDGVLLGGESMKSRPVMS